MQTQNPVAVPTKMQNLPPVADIPKRYCLYARKSSEADEKQELSIDAQIREMLELAKREGLEVVDIRRESHSAKDSGERPVFNQLIEEIRAGTTFNSLLTWAPDRLSRNAGDLGKVVDLMDLKLLLEIRTYSQNFTNNPNEKFLLMILGSQAKLENDNKSINVKRGLKTRAEMGLRPGVAPIGYLNENRTDRKCHVIVDPVRAPIIKQMFEKVADDEWSGRKIHKWLKDVKDFRTRNNKHMTLSMIYRALKTSFYYGVFEYPEKSGNWYTGVHTPIITRELFDKVQERLERDNLSGRRDKEFAFTKLMKCGLCGSGISAEEKTKHLKDGTIKKYVYYGCSRARDRECKCGYLEEGKLTTQLEKIIDKVSLDKLGMKERIQMEIERYSKFRKGVLGLDKDEAEKQQKIDQKAYAKYILREGSIYDKRELMSCLRSKIILKNKEISLSKELST